MTLKLDIKSGVSKQLCPELRRTGVAKIGVAEDRCDQGHMLKQVKREAKIGNRHLKKTLTGSFPFQSLPR